LNTQPTVDYRQKALEKVTEPYTKNLSIYLDVISELYGKKMSENEEFVKNVINGCVKTDLERSIPTNLVEASSLKMFNIIKNKVMFKIGEKRKQREWEQEGSQQGIDKSIMQPNKRIKGRDGNALNVWDEIIRDKIFPKTDGIQNQFQQSNQNYSDKLGQPNQNAQNWTQAIQAIQNKGGPSRQSTELAYGLSQNDNYFGSAKNFGNMRTKCTSLSNPLQRMITIKSLTSPGYNNQDFNSMHKRWNTKSVSTK